MTAQALEVMGSLPVLRWTSRLLATLLLLFWGAFFVEHVMEWFVEARATPPVRVLLLQAAHLVMLAGFVLLWKWELAGSTLIVAGALAFFSQTGGRRFALFFATAILPAILILFGRWHARG